jgi:hypothetical protein
MMALMNFTVLTLFWKGVCGDVYLPAESASKAFALH